MNTNLSSLDRRRFLRGLGGFALALPAFETFSCTAHAAAPQNIKRFAAFYMPFGVPMPPREDPAYQDWSWFPDEVGKEFRFTKCLDPLEPLRDEVTVLGGFSHPAARNVHGHANADQFLTGAALGGGGVYENTISLDQAFANQVGEQTRFSSLVLSTEGGIGSPRGAHTLSFNEKGRPIPAERSPKRIFDMLFVKDGEEAVRRLARSNSAIDELITDARSLHRKLSKHDQQTLNEYLQSVRDAEIKVEKAKRWLNLPRPTVDADHLNLEITAEDPKVYLQTMYELIYLAFRTDSTRTAAYQIGAEQGRRIGNNFARAVGLGNSHGLSHGVSKPGGWEKFGIYNRFHAEEFGRFISKLKSTGEPGRDGHMLDNTLVLFGSASSSFHLSRNYPLILAGGRNMGFRHGQYLRFGGHPKETPPLNNEAYQQEMDYEETALSNLYLTMIQRLGVETDTFADSTGTIAEV